MTDAINRITPSSRAAALARTQQASEAASAQRANEQARQEQARANAPRPEQKPAQPQEVVNGQGQRVGGTLNTSA